MALSLNECISKIEEVYPDMHPKHWAMYKENYIFNILPRKMECSLINADFHLVNAEDGSVSGSIPLDVIVKRYKLTQEVWEMI